MIRIRRSDGECLELTGAYEFVEMCSKDGKVACVLYADPGGNMTVVQAGTDQARRYYNRFKAEFCNIDTLKG